MKLSTMPHVTPCHAPGDVPSASALTYAPNVANSASWRLSVFWAFPARYLANAHCRRLVRYFGKRHALSSAPPFLVSIAVVFIARLPRS